MKLKTFHDLFVHELRDLYSAEKQLVRVLPKMVKSCHNQELKTALEEHIDMTQNQIKRLEDVFNKMDVSPRGVKCAGMAGLIEEGQEILDGGGEPEVLDAAIICAAQRIEHYEIAGYGCARTFAQELGEEQIASTLQKTLDEESHTDERLTNIAVGRVNVEALSGVPS